MPISAPVVVDVPIKFNTCIRCAEVYATHHAAWVYGSDQGSHSFLDACTVFGAATAVEIMPPTSA